MAWGVKTFFIKNASTIYRQICIYRDISASYQAIFFHFSAMSSYGEWFNSVKVPDSFDESFGGPFRSMKNLKLWCILVINSTKSSVISETICGSPRIPSRDHQRCPEPQLSCTTHHRSSHSKFKNNHFIWEWNIPTNFYVFFSNSLFILVEIFGFWQNK